MLKKAESVYYPPAIPPKEDLKAKAQVSTMVATIQPPKNPKDKLVIKMKQ